MTDPRQSTPQTESQDESALPATPARRIIGLAGFLIGCLLLVGALVTVFSQGDQLASATQAARHAPWYLIALALILPLVNLVFTAASFTIMTRRFGQMPHAEMTALICAAWLLNQLPMRPGLIMRLAYHKRVNHLRIRDCIRVLTEVAACAAVSTALVLGLVLLMAALGAEPLSFTLSFLGMSAIFALAAVVLRSHWSTADKPLRRHFWRYPACISLRCVDITIWAVRYVVLFSIIGSPISLRLGAAIATAGQIAMMTPVPLGLREWAVGFTSATLSEEGAFDPEIFEDHGAPPRERAGRILHDTTPGLMADVANRATEIAVCLPGGAIAGVYLLRRWRRNRNTEIPAPTPAASG